MLNGVKTNTKKIITEEDSPPKPLSVLFNTHLHLQSSWLLDAIIINLAQIGT